MRRNAVNVHLAVSAISVGLCVVVTSGRYGAFLFPSTTCIVISSIICVVFFATLIPCCVISDRKNDALSMLRIVVMSMIDFALITYTVLIMSHCLQDSNSNEFWGERQSVDVSICLDRLKSDNLKYDGLRVSRDCAESLGLTDFPHRCVGTIKNDKPGMLYAKILDPESFKVLAKSKKYEAGYCADKGVFLDFSFRCRMVCGRRKKRYVVKCELWHVSVTGEERIMKEAYVITNGYY